MPPTAPNAQQKILLFPWSNHPAGFRHPPERPVYAPSSGAGPLSAPDAPGFKRARVERSANSSVILQGVGEHDAWRPAAGPDLAEMAAVREHLQTFVHPASAPLETSGLDDFRPRHFPGLAAGGFLGLSASRDVATGSPPDGQGIGPFVPSAHDLAPFPSPPTADAPPTTPTLFDLELLRLAQAASAAFDVASAPRAGGSFAPPPDVPHCAPVGVVPSGFSGHGYSRLALPPQQAPSPPAPTPTPFPSFDAAQHVAQPAPPPAEQPPAANRRRAQTSLDRSQYTWLAGYIAALHSHGAESAAQELMRSEARSAFRMAELGHGMTAGAAIVLHQQGALPAFLASGKPRKQIAQLIVDMADLPPDARQQLLGLKLHSAIKATQRRNQARRSRRALQQGPGPPSPAQSPKSAPTSLGDGSDTTTTSSRP